MNNPQPHDHQTNQTNVKQLRECISWDLLYIFSTIDSRYITVQHNTLLYTAQQLQRQNFDHSPNSRKTPKSLPHGRAIGVFRELFGGKVTVRYRERTVRRSEIPQFNMCYHKAELQILFQKYHFFDFIEMFPMK